MKKIKMFDVMLTVDGKEYRYENNQWMDDIHIPNEMRHDLLRHLMCFHKIDLTEAYHGHEVKARLVEPLE